MVAPTVLSPDGATVETLVVSQTDSPPTDPAVELGRLAAGERYRGR
ncbi:hypothetical protein ACLQ29_19270 [Micromonospora sp. DT228]